MRPEPWLYTMLGIAGAMAFALGVAGLYGVISYSVAQRTREIGIRVALGAQNSEVRRMFVREGALLAALGIALGSIAALGLTRLMARYAVRRQAHRPVDVCCGISCSGRRRGNGQLHPRTQGHARRPHRRPAI